MLLTKFYVSIIMIAASLLYAQQNIDTTESVRSTIADSSPEVPAAKALPSSDIPDSAATTPITESVTPTENLVSENTSTPVIVESEEELILEGGEESLLPTATDKTVEPESVSTEVNEAGETVSIPSKQDSTQHDSIKAATPLELTTPEVAEKAAPLTIEKTHSIDFAKNYKEYRSPKIAILLSLFIPGTGQAYARDYLRSGIYGAVEATMITIGAVLRFQGNSKWDDAKKFASQHYSVDKYSKYYNTFSTHFGDSVLSSISQSDAVTKTFIANAKDKNGDFYDDIRETQSTYIHGWDDATPTFDDEYSIIEKDTYFFDDSLPYLVYFIDEKGDTTENSQFGFSKNQDTYNDRLSEANGKYRWSQNVFTMLLVNHIASAIDAGITAKAHNDRLLGKNTAWQRVNIRDSYVQTATGTAQGLALEVRF